MSSLYILDIRSLAQLPWANMFSHTVGCLFILMLFSLARQKLFILMRSICLVFPYVPCFRGHICEDVAA